MKYILIILLMLIPFTVSAQMPGPPPLTGLTGDNVVLDTTNFDNNLGPGDDTTQKALDTLDDAAGGSGISYSNAQAMFTDNDDGTWDTVESQVVRYGINNLIWAKLSTILGGTDITADVSTPGQVTLNYSGTSIALSDFIEGIGIEIDTSETGLAYFDIDYTVLPSLSSFVDSDSVTWNTSEVGVVIANASIPEHGDLIGLGDDDHEQYSLVDGTRPFTGQITVNGDEVWNAGNDGHLIKDSLPPDTHVTTIKGSTWSRLISMPLNSSEGHNFKMHIYSTRSGLVVSSVWEVSTCHNYRGTLVSLTGDSYSEATLRLVVDSYGAGFLEYYDGGLSSSLSLTVHVKTSVLAGHDTTPLTFYTAFTDGTTVPGTHVIRASGTQQADTITYNGYKVWHSGNMAGGVFFSEETYLNIMSSNVSGICQNLKGLWGMTGATTALEDLSYAIHSGTLEGGLTFATDRSAKNMGYTTLFNGTTDYIDLGDSDDFSFGDGSTDSAFSVGALVNVKAGTATQVILSKYDGTSGSTLKEYALQIDSTETLSFVLYDDSATGYISTVSDAALAEGYHFIIGTYSGGGTGANLNIYIDGSLVASTDADVTYTAMEDTTASLFIGARTGTAAVDSFYSSYISNSFLEKSELTSVDVWALWKLVQGVYGL